MEANNNVPNASRSSEPKKKLNAKEFIEESRRKASTNSSSDLQNPSPKCFGVFCQETATSQKILTYDVSYEILTNQIEITAPKSPKPGEVYVYEYNASVRNGKFHFPDYNSWRGGGVKTTKAIDAVYHNIDKDGKTLRRAIRWLNSETPKYFLLWYYGDEITLAPKVHENTRVNEHFHIPTPSKHGTLCDKNLKEALPPQLTIRCNHAFRKRTYFSSRKANHNFTKKKSFLTLKVDLMVL